MITTGLSPNVERDDLRLATKTLLQPWLWRYGQAEAELQAALQRFFQTDAVYPVNSGRTALLILLEALHLSTNDEVLVQAFTCNAVANPILWAGAKPVYVDIEADSYTMSPTDLAKKITPRAKVLIIQHTFGTPAKLAELLAIAKQHQLYVIEDCAHSLGARYRGQLLGTFGDAAIFSFGRDKVISSVYGGAVLTKQPLIVPTLPSPSLFWTKQQLLHPLVTQLRPLLPIAQKLKIISLAVTAGERLGRQPHYFPARLPNGLARLALHQFNKLERFNGHRQTLAAFYYQQLNQQHWFADSIYLRYTLPVLDRVAVLAEAKQHGIILGDWYSAVVVPGELQQFGYVAGSCPVAERLAATVINLPTHIGITAKHAKQICALVKPYVD